MMGNYFTATEPEAVQPPVVQSKYWCYGCETEIQNLTPEVKCPQCASTAIEQITIENDPRQYDIVTIQSENNQPQSQQPTVTNPNTNPNITNITLNNGTFRIDVISPPNSVFDIMNANLQNIFNMMGQNGQQESKATGQQLSFLDIGEVEECIICQEEGGQGLKLGCGHVFHNHCILPWFEKKNTCPTCRVVLKRTQ